jgi:MSHA biogenesis protein MshI
MHLGALAVWRGMVVAMFQFLQRVDGTRGQIGLLRTDDAVALAEVARAPDGKLRLKHCSYEAAADLPRAARRLSHRQYPTVSVLPSASYQLLLVEAPDVPGDELRAAVRWRIKDLIDFHIDDAVIDVFRMPAHVRGGPNQMLYAVVTRAEVVREHVATLEAAGLKLEVIDVLELCLRNVASLLEESGRGIALLHLGDASSVLLVMRQGVMYLTRRIETGIEALRAADGLRSSLVSGLALEARRSLDYFESHHEQTAIPVLFTSGLDPPDQDRLKQELGISVRNVDITSPLHCELRLDEETQRRCLPAIGAALRKDEATL